VILSSSHELIVLSTAVEYRKYVKVVTKIKRLRKEALCQSKETTNTKGENLENPTSKVCNSPTNT
jgi:hypothetical protein